MNYPFCVHCLTRERVHQPLSETQATITTNLTGMALCPTHFAALQQPPERETANQTEERAQ